MLSASFAFALLTCSTGEPVQDRYTRNFLPAGRQAPDFALTSLNGRTVGLKSSRDNAKATVLIFWTLGGDSSLPLIQSINAIRERVKSDLRVIAINHADELEKVKAAWSTNDIKFPCVMNKVSENDVSRTYGVVGYPSVYVLDSSEKVVASFYQPTADNVMSSLASLGISVPTR